jgi:formylglycine-generating enzyme required for sulfatase activity
MAKYIKCGILILWLLAGSLVAEAVDPQVTYVTALQRANTKLVDIWYGLSDTDGDLQSVSVVVGSTAGPIVASSFSGDIGEVYPSNSLHIVWDADADWNGNSTGLVFAVTAETVMSASSTSNMVFVPVGTNSGHDPSYGAYSLTNPKSFYMDKYEITNDEMVRVLQWAYGQGLVNVSSTTVANAYGDQQELIDLDDIQCRITWDGTNFGMRATYATGYPCIEVSWYGAASFCNYRSAMEGLEPCYDLSDWSMNTNASGYRLPLSDEWEYAARGGVQDQRFPWGQEISHDYANYMANNSYYYDISPYTNDTYDPLYYDGSADVSQALGTSPVGAFEAGKNGYGLYDMAGNVWEWCYEWYPGYENQQRIRRGGCWRSTAPSCRSGNIYRLDPPHSAHHVGFRTLLPYAGIASAVSSLASIDTTGPSRIIAVSGSLVFRNTVVGGRSAGTLVISNSGDADLQVNGLACGASFTGYWTGSVPPGGSTNVTIYFSPSAATNYAGKVTVVSDATSGEGEGELSGLGVPPVINDFDGDGVSDIAVYRPGSQRWYIKLSGGGEIRGRKWGIVGDLPMPADYDGDGTTDIAVYRPSSGWWYGILGNGGVLRKKWGIAGDQPVPADYDGDGAADLSVFRQSDSRWYVQYSGSSTNTVEKWGITGDLPVLADYDGDGLADYAIFRYGGWWVVKASLAGISKHKWGIAGDQPVPADYDGDGVADLAVYRPAAGRWYVLRSSDGVIVQRKWGIAGDVPVPADYDGDGLADFCVFRPSTGWWYVLQSSDAGIIKCKWGIPGDEPVSVQFQINRMLP